MGSYIALAIEQQDLHAVGYAILTMVIVIFLYDQILFRPLIAWSEKFKMEPSPDEEEYQSWLIDLIRGSRLIKRFEQRFAIIKRSFCQCIGLGIAKLNPIKKSILDRQKRSIGFGIPSLFSLF